MKIPFFRSKIKGASKKSNSKKAPKTSSSKTPKKTSKKSNKSNKVIIYSTKTCPWCKKTKEFLKENNIKFTNKDVGNNKNAQEMIKKSGQKGVPVVDVNGSIIVGYNEGKLRRELGL